mmetsp:Transcript_37937/g.109110  ORF Transcript_37937/g.109110 Transcript_37937/m.109110 type:complete len:302 (+) Transcript_37937:262-1167(+)
MGVPACASDHSCRADRWRPRLRGDSSAASGPGRPLRVLRCPQRLGDDAQPLVGKHRRGPPTDRGHGHDHGRGQLQPALRAGHRRLDLWTRACAACARSELHRRRSSVSRPRSLLPMDARAVRIGRAHRRTQGHPRVGARCRHRRRCGRCRSRDRRPSAVHASAAARGLRDAIPQRLCCLFCVRSRASVDDLREGPRRSSDERRPSRNVAVSVGYVEHRLLFLHHAAGQQVLGPPPLQHGDRSRRRGGVPSDAVHELRRLGECVADVCVLRVHRRGGNGLRLHKQLRPARTPVPDQWCGGDA